MDLTHTTLEQHQVDGVLITAVSRASADGTVDIEVIGDYAPAILSLEDRGHEIVLPERAQAAA